MKIPIIKENPGEWAAAISEEIRRPNRMKELNKYQITIFNHQANSRKKREFAQFLGFTTFCLYGILLYFNPKYRMVD